MKTILLAIIAHACVLTLSAKSGSFYTEMQSQYRPSAAGYAQTSGLYSVRLHDFTAEQKATDISISWITDNEANLIGFDIERSTDGLNFSYVNTVAGTNTDYTHRYQFTDKKASYLSEKLFYRLKLRGTSNQTIYTEYIVVYVEGVVDALVTPSVVSRGTNIVLTVKDEINPTGPIKMDCTDMFGRVVFSQSTTPGSQVSINSSNLNKGIYLIQLLNKEGGHTRLRFVVQ